MFILRRVTSEGRVSNEIIGNSYHFIFDDRPINKDGEFDESVKTGNYEGYKVLLNGYTKDVQDEIHAFIMWNDGKDWKPIYKKSQYYIMTESGKTFDTIRRFHQ